MKRDLKALLCLDTVLGREYGLRKRVSSVLTAAGVYLCGVLLQAYAVALGMADGGEALIMSILIAAASIGFYVMLRSGWSQRLADPAMTLPQMGVGIVFLAASYAINPQTRATSLMVVALVLMFGSFTVSAANCRRLSWAAVAVLGVTMGACARAMPDRFEPHVELIHFIFSAAVVPALGLLAGQLSGIRSSLKSERAALRTALGASEQAQRELVHERGQLLMQIEKEAMYRQVFDAVSEAILVKGPDSAILWANRASCEFYGMSNHRLQGLVDAPGSAPDQAPQLGGDDAQVVAGGVALDIPDRAVTRHDGVVRRWHTVKSPIFDGTGAVVATVSVSRDITAQNQVQQALQASRAFLDQTGRIGGVGGWSLDVSTQAMLWTGQTSRIHELEPGVQPSPWESLHYYAPQARPVIEQALRRSIATGEGFDLELSLVTARGNAIWVRVVAEPDIVDGRVVRVLGALQDITARRAMETELRHNGELLASVLEHIPCGLSAYDTDLKFVLTNAEFGRLLGLPHSLVSRPGAGLEDVLDFAAARGDYGTRDVEATVAAIIAEARGPKVPHSMLRRQPDGTTLEIRVAPMPDGRFILTHSDVTARQQAEQALHRQTERLRLAADSAGIGVWEYDPALAALDWDDWMYRIYGVARTEGTQTLEAWSAHFHPDDAGRVMAELNAALEGRGDFRPGFRICRPDGEVRFLQAAAHVARDAEGRPVRMTGVNIDVTLQRQSEQALREAKQAAESANVAKSAFLANMSHEIRTPMNAILGMLALLHKTEMTPRQADYAGKTESAARSLLGLLNDILDFSKVEAGKMVLNPEPFGVDRLMGDLAVILSASGGTKNLEVLFDIDPAVPPLVVGDAMRLQQVLINLGGNAVKFTAEGEVVISIAVRDCSAGRVSLEFSVRDTGIGIAPDDHARIFTGFTQAEASTTRRFGGTGLGLAISQRLVAMMGSELRLDSTPGQGTRFHFCIDLPVVAGRTAWVAPANGSRVLIVDDNPTARDVLARAAQSLGWTTQVATRGEEALECVRDEARAGHRFDAVFTDWRMPGLDVWETLRLIRDEHAGASAPLFLMLGRNSAESLLQRDEDVQALAEGFLVKPFTASMLAAALHEAQHGPASSAGLTTCARRLEGMRVLVAEDNANNQQVARELLEDEGALVQIAADGQAAVDALAAPGQSFDVVLMDVQMPVMDGYTATVRIRQLGMKDLPIIAMTANAMASDRAACLAAGMNDHVGKPFDLSNLVAVLLRHTGRAGAPADAKPAGSALPVELLEAADRRGIALAAAVNRLGGNSRLYLRALHTFARDLPALPGQLSRLLQQGLLTESGNLMHTTKGLAATLGLRQMASLTAEIEGALHAADAATPLDDLAATFGSTVATTMQDIAHVAGVFDQCLPVAIPSPDALDSGASDAIDDLPALRRSLDELTVLLRGGDMRAVAVFEQLQRAHPASIGGAMKALVEAMARLDFDLAAEHCRAMSETVGP